MHQENIIATGAHPVPIDLEMILQPADSRIRPRRRRERTGLRGGDADSHRFRRHDRVTAGVRKAVHQRGIRDRRREFELVTANDGAVDRVNTDAMRPVKETRHRGTIANLPYIDGRRGQPRRPPRRVDARGSATTHGSCRAAAARPDGRLRRLGGPHSHPADAVLRRLLARLRDHRTMDDGVVWSAQADFAARLADWERESDPNWPLQRSERIGRWSNSTCRISRRSATATKSEMRQVVDPRTGTRARRAPAARPQR